MKKNYEKNELTFSIICIIAYVVGFSVFDSISDKIGFEKILTVPFGIIFAAAILIFIKKNGLTVKYGLCRFNGSCAQYLFFIPLAIIGSVNLWNGMTMNYSAAESVFYVISMLCAGFIEEIIFRGFLFKAIEKSSLKQAIVISSLTFGIGHIVNLLNGAPVLATLLQICYASAIGFLFTILFYKGKSLIPCIITHAAVNSLSVFAAESTETVDIIVAAVLTVVAAAYALWILKKPANE